jgi:hypothetical protein
MSLENEDITLEFLPYFKALRPSIQEDELREILIRFDWDIQETANYILEMEEETSLPSPRMPSPIEHRMSSPFPERIQDPTWEEDDWSTIRQEQDDAYNKALEEDRIKQEKIEFQERCIQFEDSPDLIQGEHKIRIRFRSGKTKIVGMPFKKMLSYEFLNLLGVTLPDQMRVTLRTIYGQIAREIEEVNLYLWEWD